MIDALFLYSLSIYWLFHLLTRADLLSAPRRWVFSTFPSWLTYPLGCAYCFTFWVGLFFAVATTFWVGVVAIPFCLLAAPVFNLVLDLGVRALIRANEPPIIPPSATETPYSITVLGGGGGSGGSIGTGMTYTCSPYYSYYLDSTNLPVTPSHIGRRAMIKATREKGVITAHFIDRDDCSGTFQQECYEITRDDGVGLHRKPISECELILESNPPA